MSTLPEGPNQLLGERAVIVAARRSPAVINNIVPGQAGGRASWPTHWAHSPQWNQRLTFIVCVAVVLDAHTQTHRRSSTLSQYSPVSSAHLSLIVSAF